MGVGLYSAASAWSRLSFLEVFLIAALEGWAFPAPEEAFAIADFVAMDKPFLDPTALVALLLPMSDVEFGLDPISKVNRQASVG